MIRRLLLPVLRTADFVGRKLLPRSLFAWLRQRVVHWLDQDGSRRAQSLRRKDHDRNEITVFLDGFVPTSLGSPRPPSLTQSATQHSRENCKIVVCCAFSGRHQILSRVILESFAANSGDEIRWMIVGSDEADMAFIKAVAAQTGRVAGGIVVNDPLGRKWQTCVRLAHAYFDADLYGITGSDDILSSALIDYVVSRHDFNNQICNEPDHLPVLYSTMEWLIVNTSGQSVMSAQILRCNYSLSTAFQPLGAGRFYTAAFMDRQAGIIFESNKERLLDDRGYFEVQDTQGPVEYMPLNNAPLISVKGDWKQMNDLRAITEAPTLDVTEYTFEGFSLLQRTVSGSTLDYLFRSGRLGPQLSFSIVPTGL